MTLTGYSALEAKNNGIMMAWPMPINRSRLRTSPAMVMDRAAEERGAEHEYHGRADQLERVRGPVHPEDRGQDQHHERLDQRAYPGRERLARHQRGLDRPGHQLGPVAAQLLQFDQA